MKDYKQKYEVLFERISNLVRDYDCVSGLIDVREELKSILNESQDGEDVKIKNKEPLPMLSLTIQVRPEDIVFHDSMIYGRNVNVRSWEYLPVEGFSALVEQNIKSIKKEHFID